LVFLLILFLKYKNFRRRVFDQQTGQDIILSDEQVEKLQAIASSRYPEIGLDLLKFL